MKRVSKPALLALGAAAMMAAAAALGGSALSSQGISRADIMKYVGVVVLEAGDGATVVTVTVNPDELGGPFTADVRVGCLGVGTTTVAELGISEIEADGLHRIRQTVPIPLIELQDARHVVTLTDSTGAYRGCALVPGTAAARATLAVESEQIQPSPPPAESLKALNSSANKE